MARIYAIANQKGGVGRRVLVVDLDPQANATSALGFDKNQMKPSTYELLLDQAPVGDVRLRHDEFGLDSSAPCRRPPTSTTIS